MGHEAGSDGCIEGIGEDDGQSKRQVEDSIAGSKYRSEDLGKERMQDWGGPLTYLSSHFFRSVTSRWTSAKEGIEVKSVVCGKRGALLGGC